MKYTHYHPVTGERGTVTKFSTYELTQEKFEKLTERLVKTFDKHSSDYRGDTYDITLHTGERFFFRNDIGSTLGYIFRSEGGEIRQASAHFPECAPDSEKTTRVRIELITGGDTLTPFKPYHRSAGLLQDIEEGKGAMYNDENQRLTVIPYRNIKQATIITAPYGG